MVSEHARRISVNSRNPSGGSQGDSRPCIPEHEAFHALVEVVDMDAFLEPIITTKVYRDD